MTEDERRNPKPEIGSFSLADSPELHVSDLEVHHVYILHGERFASSLNYMGKIHSLDPLTLDVVVLHRFYGPRANLNVCLKAQPDGTLQDGCGMKVTIRKYSGEDA